MSVFDHAVRMEQEAKGYYERLAQQTRCSELKSIFLLLADAESSHYRSLLSKAGTKVESPVLEACRKLFQQLLSLKDVAAGFSVDSDGYLHAVKAEEESIRYYQQAADQAPDDETKGLLLALVAEEKLHLNIIENIYEFVEAPRSYLEAVEFSNRKTL